MKKGFTLAEILGVIVIVGILLVLIVPAVINRITESEDEVKGATGNIIYDAADQYIKEHPDLYPPGQSGRYCITIKSLIEDGKLVEPVIDPSTGEDISDKSVMVTIYTAGTSDFELTEKDTCEEIASVSFIDFDVTPKGSSWVKQRTVKIIWPKMDGDYKARYRIDNGEWIYVDDINSYNGGTTEIIFNKSSAKTPLEAQYVGKGEDATSITDSRINIVNIDSVAPKCTLSLTGTKGDNDWYVSNVTVDFGDNRKNLTDDLSGVDDYGISTSSSDTFGKISSKIQSVDTDYITYYGYVIDKAGNIGRCNTKLRKDSTKPTCEVKITDGKKGNNDWYITNVKFDMTYDDNLSGIQQKGMNNKNSVNYNNSTSMTLSSDTTGITYYGFVKDNAGNTTKCSEWAKRDVTAPTCTPKKSNQYTPGGVTVSYSCTDATSKVVSCPNAKTGLKSNVSAITIYDNAGNSGTCAAQTIKKQTQYRKKTRSNRTCSDGNCCGWINYSYVCGQNCTRWRCVYIGADGEQLSHIEVTLTYECPSFHIAPNGLRRELRKSECINSEDKYCDGTYADTCTKSCCGYTPWSGYGSWGTGNYCTTSATYCQDESRVVYY